MDEKVSTLDTISVIDRATDLVYVVDTSAGTPNKSTVNGLLGISGDPIGTNDSQTLTNKIITAPTISSPTFSGTITGTYTLGGTPTFPSSVVTTTGTQTLTNKTLTAPSITGANISNPALSTDAINEFTPGSGVNVDGLIIKDALLPVGNIQPLNLMSGTGSSWVWQSWVPTITGITIGNGVTNEAKYVQIGKNVFVKFLFTFGSTTTLASDPVISLPVTAASVPGNFNTLGEGTFYDSSATSGVVAMPCYATPTSIALKCLFAGGSYGTYSGVNATVPFTWATSDEISCHFIYEAV